MIIMPQIRLNMYIYRHMWNMYYVYNHYIAKVGVRHQSVNHVINQSS